MTQHDETLHQPYTLRLVIRYLYHKMFWDNGRPRVVFVYIFFLMPGDRDAVCAGTAELRMFIIKFYSLKNMYIGQGAKSLICLSIKKYFPFTL
jgi:hypothetical protein